MSLIGNAYKHCEMLMEIVLFHDDDCDGAYPYCCLKIRLKWVGSLKPKLWALRSSIISCRPVSAMLSCKHRWLNFLRQAHNFLFNFIL